MRGLGKLDGEMGGKRVGGAGIWGRGERVRKGERLLVFSLLHLPLLLFFILALQSLISLPIFFFLFLVSFLLLFSLLLQPLLCLLPCLLFLLSYLGLLYVRFLRRVPEKTKVENHSVFSLLKTKSETNC